MAYLARAGLDRLLREGGAWIAYGTGCVRNSLAYIAVASR